MTVDSWGDGSTTQRTSPVQVLGVSNVAQVFSGVSYTVFVKTDGTLWAMGFNGNGQFGNGTTISSTTPRSSRQHHCRGGATLCARERERRCPERAPLKPAIHPCRTHGGQPGNDLGGTGHLYDGSPTRKRAGVRMRPSTMSP